MPYWLLSSAVRLRPWRISDLELIQEACLDPSVRRMLGLRPGCGRRAVENWIARVGSTSLVMELDGQLVGEVGLEPDASGRSALLSYWVLARFRGRGLAQQGAGLMCERGAGLVLTAYVSERNLASVRVLEKLGFQRGGLIRQYAGYSGPRDTYIYFRLPEP